MIPTATTTPCLRSVHRALLSPSIHFRLFIVNRFLFLSFFPPVFVLWLQFSSRHALCSGIRVVFASLLCHCVVKIACNKLLFAQINVANDVLCSLDATIYISRLNVWKMHGKLEIRSAKKRKRKRELRRENKLPAGTTWNRHGSVCLPIEFFAQHANVPYSRSFFGVYTNSLTVSIMCRPAMENNRDKNYYMCATK